MKKITLFLFATVFLSGEVLPKVVISADPAGGDLQNIANSVEVLDSKKLNDRLARHFGDIVTQMGNVNFSGESSRAKFIQIRGIGERSQYTRSPDTSVGFMIDGIDFSGIGAGANLFDIKKVEVLRGPQSTRFGASALAGLINIESNDPESDRNSHLEASVASYNQKSLGVATTGSFAKSPNAPQYRIAIHKAQSDGFYHNRTLDRKDTNNIDELTIRAKLRFFLGNKWQSDLTVMRLDLDNGYDKWAGNSGFDTFSNRAGEDKQRSNAGAIKLFYEDGFKFTYLASYADHTLFNSYDGDWEATGDDFYQTDRDRTHATNEFRFASVDPILGSTTDWLVGVYGSKLSEKSTIDEIWWGDRTITKTDYKVTKTAVFGQLDHHLSHKTTLVGALRVENIDNEFTHTAEAGKFSPDETLWGGQIALRHKLTQSDLIYASVTKGYKAGGFNAGTGVTDRNKLEYKAESAINYELGHKHKSARLKLNSAVFYIDRVDAQLSGSEQKAGRSDFRFYTINSDDAYNYGLESDLEFEATEDLDLIASLGLIKTSFKRAASELATIEPKTRELAHAPNYQYMVATHYTMGRYFARLEAQGMDKFYFSNSSHDQKSSAYNIGNFKIGYESDAWDLSLWCKNFTDEKYATRGFFFDRYDGSGNKLYTALGDPRVFGATVRARF